MAKNLKLNIKNTQIAEAVNLGGLKSKLAKKKADAAAKVSPDKSAAAKEPVAEELKEEAPRIKARSRSAFAESHSGEEKASLATPEASDAALNLEAEANIAAEEIVEPTFEEPQQTFVQMGLEKEEIEEAPSITFEEEKEEVPSKIPPVSEEPVVRAAPQTQPPKTQPPQAQVQPLRSFGPPKEKLGPTGRHIKDLIPPRPAPKAPSKEAEAKAPHRPTEQGEAAANRRPAAETPSSGKFKGRVADFSDEEAKKGGKPAKVKEFRDIKPAKRTEEQRSFDSRDRQGLRIVESDEDKAYRKKRRGKLPRLQQEDITIRPTELKIRVPILIKDLASEMKLKASELIGKLFLQGIIVTINDILTDETMIQLLGHEFGCSITIDTSEEERIRITDRSIKEEIQATEPEKLQTRPPVVAFMGHVDHGKTSLIDAIRKTNRASGEAGAITQHIGAFRCHTAVGDIAILDTPGHEAFSAMRARGADVTDIVVLVVAGDEGIRQQTTEAIQHAKAAGVTIVVAINKCDKPNFNAENVYRQLAEIDLLPETWGGQTITVNCSAATGQGVKDLLEMLALQAEVLELRANPEYRARGTVLESEMHKGLGSVATVLVQNGTLKRGDALVFGNLWGRIKTMHNEFGKELLEAGPSTPVEITGLSGLPEAGEEFIVVKSEKEAREIAEVRMQDMRRSNLQLSKRQTVESLFQAAETSKKILNIVLRADVQGSLEAIKVALQKIESQKAELAIISAGVGEVSESDVQLAAASKAVIIGFHTQIESHADTLVKQIGVQVRMHDIIYHAIDDVKLLMVALLDKIPQENEKGKALVKATFKASHVGVIAGCQVTEGTIVRNHQIRVVRDGEVVWKGSIASLKRVKEDVREVQKGLECGILLNNFNDLKENDILEAYDITYMTQEL